MSEALPPGLVRRKALRACLDRIVTEAERMRTTLPQLNQVDPGLENRINLLSATVERTVAAHLDEPGEGLADDLEGLRSATRRLRVPAEEPGLGETYALRELGAAQGRMLNAVLDAQDEARDQGFRQMASSVERNLGIDIQRAGNEDVLRDIAARLDEVVERLDQFTQARNNGSDFRAEGRLLDFYIGKMRVQVDLARLQLRIGERTVDFSALWRATQSMSELTQGFIETVMAWAGRVSSTVTKLATDMGQKIRGVASGVRVAVRAILRRRQAARDADPRMPPRLQSPTDLPLPPIGFFCYTRSDDLASNGRLSGLRMGLATELQLRLGRRDRVRIFQDVAAIPYGTNWQEQISIALDQSSFLIPILTPDFLQSEMCCQEVMRFREREIALGRNDLILPVHYVTTDKVDPTQPGACYDAAVFELLRSRQWIEFRHLRTRQLESDAVMEQLSIMASSIDEALYRSVLTR